MNWIWIAGFFEGEGNVYWREGNEGSKQSMSGHATLGQKEKPALQAIYDFLLKHGFSQPSFYLRPISASKSAQGKPSEIWILTIQKRDDVIKFYSKVAPHLFSKKSRALYVLNRLSRERSERDRKLSRALRMRKQGMYWHEIAKRLGIGRTALTNYARSKGIILDKDDPKITRGKYRKSKP